MFRKTFIRLALIVVIATVGLIVYAATRAVPPTTRECYQSKKECGSFEKQGDFFILESLGHSLFTNARY